MAKRRKYGKRNKFKLKLKKGTVYSIFAFGQILLGLLLLLSFTRDGGSFILLNDVVLKYFGSVSILLPLLFIFFGFLSLRLRLFISRPNVAVGFLIFIFSLASLLKAGEV